MNIAVVHSRIPEKEQGPPAAVRYRGEADVWDGKGTYVDGWDGDEKSTKKDAYESLLLEITSKLAGAVRNRAEKPRGSSKELCT